VLCGYPQCTVLFAKIRFCADYVVPIQLKQHAQDEDDFRDAMKAWEQNGKQSGQSAPTRRSTQTCTMAKFLGTVNVKYILRDYFLAEVGETVWLCRKADNPSFQNLQIGPAHTPKTNTVPPHLFLCHFLTHTFFFGRLKWLCHFDEFGDIVWRLHHSLHHMLKEVMHETVHAHCAGSTWLPSNMPRELLGRFQACCPCTTVVKHLPAQQTVVSLRSQKAMERVRRRVSRHRCRHFRSQHVLCCGCLTR